MFDEHVLSVYYFHVPDEVAFLSEAFDALNTVEGSLFAMNQTMNSDVGQRREAFGAYAAAVRRRTTVNCLYMVF